MGRGVFLEGWAVGGEAPTLLGSRSPQRERATPPIGCVLGDSRAVRPAAAGSLCSWSLPGPKAKAKGDTGTKAGVCGLLSGGEASS